ncbi:TIGR03086 family metal-binding protein [Planobispora siamensis]|uniref:TIGR03086 family protein n=1 Tax=Planobispora siamensis TaxID=936338 RepID=A0A8J3SGQ2_9ACTN|nr:TIGR03086 family metal-binding protein [Planobispora siamensis]GIH94027.1 TIGR03086 family protein [Planobispora siamensis]
MIIDIREAYRRALDDFGALVHRIAPEQWENATPCVDWNVRALVNHVVGESLWVPELLAGRTVAELGDTYDGDLLGDDPGKAFDAAASAAVHAASADGSLTCVTHLSFGDVPGREYITELFADALIHTWDLARAIGADDRLDPELVETCADWFAGAEDGYRQAGVIGEQQPLPPDPDPQTRLLASWGRRT